MNHIARSTSEMCIRDRSLTYLAEIPNHTGLITCIKLLRQYHRRSCQPFCLPKEIMLSLIHIYIVAAEILMDSDEVLRYIYEYGYTAEQIASTMSTDINLVALKVAHLATLGYNLHALEHKSNFLK